MVPNAADGWNHSVHYHDLLLGAVPRPCRRALDVGCGLGGFARRLAGVSDRVDALDRSPAVLSRARELSSGIPHLRFIEADFMTWPAEGTYDFVSMIACLHHMPFGPALARGKALLAPGGVLAVLGLDRAQSPLDRLARAVLGLPVSLYYRTTRRSSPVGAPEVDPLMTLDEIRRASSGLLPGATLQRHVLWRYSLVWTRPATISVDSGTAS